MAKLNAEVDTTTAKQYRVLSYPTILVLNDKGEEIDRVVGYYRAPEFMSQVEDYVAGRNTLGSMIAEEPAKKNDPEFIYKLADRYADHGLYEEARKHFLVFVALDPRNQSQRTDDAYYRLARMARKDHDYVSEWKYAKVIVDRYPDSDMYRSGILEMGQGHRKNGELAVARQIFLDYAKRFPQDEDAPWAKEQADTLGAQIAAKRGA
jgi:TolA-binding protein